MSNARLGQYSFRFVEFLRLVEVIWIRTCVHLWVLLFIPVQAFRQQRTTKPLRSIATSASLPWVTVIIFLDSAIMFVYMGGAFVGSIPTGPLIWTNRVLNMPSFCIIGFEFVEFCTQLLFLLRVQGVILPEPAPMRLIRQ
jgi:hypothetical protein